jgi:predicted 2-oxoglutarate/Fe(II)-dependent dioxygenase YbiX/peroxiredoxin
MGQYKLLLPGDPAPWFRQRSLANPGYVFDTAAGRYIVLCFFWSAGDAQAKAALSAVAAHEGFFDDARGSFFGVSADPADESEGRIADRYPGLRFLLDYDGAVGRFYGSLPHDATAGATGTAVRRLWFVLDPTLRVMRAVPFAPDGSDVAEVLAYVDGLPPPGRFAGLDVPAPILVLPNVFERAFCDRLIGLYEEDGGTESGFMREVDGRTVTLHDHNHKRRKDYVIEDSGLVAETQKRVVRTVVPEIRKVHQFTVTRMERYIVSCYSASDGGHFRAHRDNTTKGTAHRRFALSVNLNGDFDGGEVSFPEYGPRSFKAPPGGAVVFSCSLLHAVSPVTRGQRYAFLPFLYDDAAAKIREANNAFLGDGVGRYRQA